LYPIAGAFCFFLFLSAGWLAFSTAATYKLFLVLAASGKSLHNIQLSVVKTCFFLGFATDNFLILCKPARLFLFLSVSVRPLFAVYINDIWLLPIVSYMSPRGVFLFSFCFFVCGGGGLFPNRGLAQCLRQVPGSFFLFPPAPARNEKARPSFFSGRASFLFAPPPSFFFKNKGGAGGACGRGRDLLRRDLRYEKLGVLGFFPKQISPLYSEYGRGGL
jgi:hypothetical protein